MPTHRYVAEFVDGGDVMIGEEVIQNSPGTSSEIKGSIVKQQVVMRVSSHRRFVGDADSNSHTPTLHRVVLATRGRSIVSYASLVELLSAAQCAAEGTHATLTIGQSLTLSKVSIQSFSLGWITRMLVSATSFSAQTRKKRRDSFLISTCLPSVIMQPRLLVLMTTTQLLRR